MTGPRRGFAGAGLIFLLVPLVFMLLIFYYPLLFLLTYIRQSSLIWNIFTEPFYITILLRTLAFAAKVTVFSLLIAYPCCCFISTLRPRSQKAWMFILTLPLWTSVLARTYAWIIILGRKGIVNGGLQAAGVIDQPLMLMNNTFGAVVGSVYVMMPVMLLSLYGPIRSIDRSSVHAARTLGASPAAAFLKVFLPLSMPGIISGCLLVFTLSLGLFVAPALLGGPYDRTFSTVIAQRVDMMADFGGAATLSVFFLVVTLLVLILAASLFGTGPFRGSRTSHIPLSRRGGIPFGSIALLERFAPFLQWKQLWALFLGVVSLLLMLPYVALLLIATSSDDYVQFPPSGFSLRWFHALFSTGTWTQSAFNSLVIGCTAAVISVAMGIAAALGMKHLNPARRNMVMLLLVGASVIPAMIYALAAYFAAVQVGLSDSRIGIALAHAAMGTPFAVVLCVTAHNAIPASIEEAARSLGAGYSIRARRIILPIMLPAVVSSFFVAFQTSYDELVVSLFLSGVKTPTFPKVMWQATTLEVTPIIAAASVAMVVLVLLLGGAVLGLSKVVRRGAPSM